MISGDARYIINNKYSQVQDPIQFGTLTRIGTADFYPGTGYGAYGCFQPGCFEIGDVGACSHSKSHEYYMASITKAICFASRYILYIILAKGPSIFILRNIVDEYSCVQKFICRQKIITKV